MVNVNHLIEPRVKSFDSLLYQLYEHSYFPSSIRQHFKRNGELNKWALDLRVPLARSEFLQPVSLLMIEILKKNKISQIIGRGYGSFFLVGGIVSNGHNFTAGLLRESPKTSGFQKLIEGNLDHHLPVYVIDDILSSGKTVAGICATLLAESFCPRGVVTVFKYEWGQAEERLKEYDLNIECLATLRKGK